MKIIKIITVAALIFTLGSCCGCRNGKSKGGYTLANTNWQLVQLEGNNFTATSDSFTLMFNPDDMRVIGKGDCNRVNGSYDMNSNGKLQLKGMISTRAFCPDQASEDRFVRMLGDIDSYRIDGNMLMLFANGDLKMVMEAR